MYLFLVGIYLALSLVVFVFFLRFWRDSNDPLFLRFSMAFSILAVERIALLVVQVEREANSFLYLLRLVAFSLLAWALIDKNRKKPRLDNSLDLK